MRVTARHLLTVGVVALVVGFAPAAATSGRQWTTAGNPGIRLGAAIGPVKLLMTRGEVEARLGRGTATTDAGQLFNTFGRAVFYARREVVVLYGSTNSFAPPGSVGRVVGIATTSAAYRTATGLGVGSTIPEVKGRYPAAECYAKTGCWLRAPRGSYHRPTTVFHARKGVIKQVTVQFTESEQS